MQINCSLLGEDFDQVKNYHSSSKKKINGMAATLMIPVLTYFITVFLIAKNFYLIGTPSAIGCAVGASYFIWLIEKSIILAKTQHEAWKWVIGIVRVLLGILISLIAAIFIDQLVFKTDIDRKTGEILKQENVKKFDLTKLEMEVNEKYNKYQDDKKQAESEADGTGGSRKPGLKGVAEYKKKLAEQSHDDYLKAKSNLELKSRILEQDLNQDKFKKNNESFIARMQALEQLLNENSSASFFRWVLTILMVIVESLVVLFKFSSKQSIDELMEEKREKLLITRIEQIVNQDNKIFKLNNPEYLKEDFNSRLTKRLAS